MMRSITVVSVPEINKEAEAKRVTLLYRQKLIEAMRTFSAIADAKTMQRVPITRIATALDWKTKLLISVRKFVPGFIVGALGTLAAAVASGGVGAILAGGPLASAGIYGILGGLGLTGAKYVKETRRDRKLDREVRKPETMRLEGYNSAQMEWVAKIVNIVMSIAKAANLDTQAALRQVYTMLELLGDVPYEVGEFLLTLSTVVEDGTARGGFTAEEIKAVLDEASDVKDALSRIHQLWDER